MGKKKKVKIPGSVLELKWGPEKFAKKHNIKIKGKGMGKKRKKEAQKKLIRSYSASTIENLNKAVKILSENPGEGKKILKLREGVDSVIINTDVMKRVAKLYKKEPKNYPNMIFLPYMITNTIVYYNQEGLSEKEQSEGERLDKVALLGFCEQILKRQIKHYRNQGLSGELAFEMANVIPTTKILSGRKGRDWYKTLIRKLYTMAEQGTVDLVEVLDAIRSVDKKKDCIGKKEFFEGFFSEFILNKSSNKSHTYNDTQKELHENLVSACLEYMESLKEKKLREMLKTYIRRRKTAEQYKNDSKRMIRFIDHANSNSPYNKLKTVIQDLISDNSNNELYLS